MNLIVERRVGGQFDSAVTSSGTNATVGKARAPESVSLGGLAELDELALVDTYDEDETPVPLAILDLGRVVCREARHAASIDPEIVALHDGSLSFLWRFVGGIASLEIKGDQFGAFVRRSGRTVFLYNGPVGELRDFVRRGLNSYLNSYGVGLIEGDTQSSYLVPTALQPASYVTSSSGQRMMHGMLTAVRSKFLASMVSNAATGLQVDVAAT